MASADFYEECVGQEFYVEGLEVPYPLTLKEVARTQTSMREGGGFSLLFESSSKDVLSQAVYFIAGDNHKAELFLVPVGESANGIRYESIFN